MSLATIVLNPNATLPSGGLEGATDDVITATYWNRAMNLLFSSVGTAGYIGCRAFSSSNQSLTSGVQAAIALNGERWDSDPNGAIHDTVTNNSRLTCRTAGTYLITGSFEMTANATGSRYGIIILNGATQLVMHNVPVSTAAIATTIQLTTVYLLAATDYVEMYAYQDSGGALNVLTVGARSPELTMAKI